MTESEHSDSVERVVETHSQQQQPSGLGERPSQARYQETDAKICELMSETMFDRAKDEEPEQQQQRGTETSAADGPADAKQQQPGWTEAADVDQWHNKYLQLKTFYHWRSILRTQWIIDQQTPTQWIIAECMRLPLQRADEDDMLADWLANRANIMSLQRYQKDTRYNKIKH